MLELALGWGPFWGGSWSLGSKGSYCSEPWNQISPRAIGEEALEYSEAGSRGSRQPQEQGEPWVVGDRAGEDAVGTLLGVLACPQVQAGERQVSCLRGGPVERLG